MKPGYQTTEFWVTVLTVINGAVGSSLGLTETQADQVIAQIAAAIVAIAYIVSRIVAKRST